MLTNLYHLAQQKQTYLNILYLLVSFPLGLIYFLFLLVGISVGISTLIVWIGIPVLFVTMTGWWYLAAFERSHTINWLQIQISPMSLNVEKKKTFLQRIRAQLSNGMIWKTLLYLFLKFPFGLFSFTCALCIPLLMFSFSLVTFIFGLLVIPFFYLYVVISGKALNISAMVKGIFTFLLVIATIGVTGVFLLFIISGWPLPHLLAHDIYAVLIGFVSRMIVLTIFVLCIVLIGLMFRAVSSLSIEPRQQDTLTHVTTLKQMLLVSLTGCGLILTPLYMLNGMATLWGRFARAMLGMSDNAMRVVEAEAVAARERAKAERAEQSRRELIVNVSHELRTPVASIRGHIESLLLSCDVGSTQTPPPEALHKYLTIVYREATRLGTLVDDLLSLARTEANELHLNIAAVEIAEVVEEVYQTLMPLARRERQITLIHDISPGLPMVMADRQRLIQVLLNLVRNAITYTPDGGIVSLLLVRKDEQYLSLSVADTGIGIPPEELEHIFERFYRTDASRTRSSGGFGLGLAIVRDFVTDMGGAVSVESKVGEGSCFCVKLRIV